eukprot:CAMPEP_0118896480 /NCGR_PEP_ID=MMETSP1166-20130328/4330_1 /TAXON_ID=1104430 /ORGANISM="Chrysoreinhardia sp, Strain CCMP3193" /LENGTH=79 /DNA_ID=CAMNT_0006835539 /DNA_START=38 /DNA_END=277 /DNA_ORIENTATION=+
MAVPLEHPAFFNSRKRSRESSAEPEVSEIEAIKRLRIAAPPPPPVASFPANLAAGDVDYSRTNELLNRLHGERVLRRAS